MLTVIDGLGLLAGGLTTVAFVPQVLKIHASKSGEDLSLGMMLIFSTGVLMWLIYGLLIDSAPLIAANLVTLALSLTIVFLKIRYARRRSRPNDPAVP
jgi:MtN3 and saliva related transmembrane protein